MNKAVIPTGVVGKVKRAARTEVLREWPYYV